MGLCVQRQFGRPRCLHLVALRRLIQYVANRQAAQQTLADPTPLLLAILCGVLRLEFVLRA